MTIDPFSGRNPSYCFVDLDPAEDPEEIIQRLRGYRIRNRPIKVHCDTGARAHGPRRVETQMEKGEYRAFNFTPTPMAADTPSVYHRFDWKGAREHWTKPVEQKRRVFIGGMSDISDREFVDAEMRQLFGGFNVEAVSKRVLPAHFRGGLPATGQCYCFANLPSAIEAQEAVDALNGKPTPYGGVYRLKIAHCQQDRTVCREQADLLGIRRVTNEAKRNLDGNWRSRM